MKFWACDNKYSVQTSYVVSNTPYCICVSRPLLIWCHFSATYRTLKCLDLLCCQPGSLWTTAKSLEWDSWLSPVIISQSRISPLGLRFLSHTLKASFSPTYAQLSFNKTAIVYTFGEYQMFVNHISSEVNMIIFWLMNLISMYLRRWQ